MEFDVSQWVVKTTMTCERYLATSNRTTGISISKLGYGWWLAGLLTLANRQSSIKLEVYLICRIREQLLRPLLQYAPQEDWVDLRSWIVPLCFYLIRLESWFPVLFPRSSEWRWQYLDSSRNKLLKSKLSLAISLSNVKLIQMINIGRI